ACARLIKPLSVNPPRIAPEDLRRVRRSMAKSLSATLIILRSVILTSRETAVGLSITEKKCTTQYVMHFL
ncbi:MAG: hypothetical protein E7B34_23515, partial [Hafnia alvei]|nr:hypothetical protein [Hafnia alvei]